MVPVHNCAPYLNVALSEVVAQLGKRDDAEIVVVDDASTDDPAAVVDRLGQGRVRYVANPHNLGAIGTFNRCVELASGEFVHLLHGDDAILPGFYDAMERALADPDVVAAVCRTRFIDADGTPGATSRSYRNGTGVWADALEAQAVSNRIRPPGIVVRRSVYERIGGYREDLPHAADWDMWTRLAATGPIVFVDEVLSCYRRHDGSDTADRVRTGVNVRERIAALGMISQYLPPHRHPGIIRRGLVFAAVFATRTAASLARNGDMRGAARQLWEAVRCLARVPSSLPQTVINEPPRARGTA
jgi:GT2 family glycosyltransferase